VDTSGSWYFSIT